MNELGTLAELPSDYLEALTDASLVPLWPSLRSLLPPGAPKSATVPTHWRWRAIRPLLLKAGELTPMEKAERRVLVLANPGRGLDNLQASSTIYLGMQLVLPGETAPNHRHTPNAARIVVEGEGAFTIVDGVHCPMEPGDLILTPTGLWHEHRHEGRGPMIWLDVLDLPLIIYLDRSYVTGGSPQMLREPAEIYRSGGLVPLTAGRRSGASYPLLRYPWRQARQSLEAMAGGIPAGSAVQLAYVNPETGAAPLNTLAFGAILVRPGEAVVLARDSAARVFHAVEGEGVARIGGVDIRFDQGDAFIAPGAAAVRLRNVSSRSPLFLITADDSPVQGKLGVFERWDD